MGKGLFMTILVLGSDGEPVPDAHILAAPDHVIRHVDVPWEETRENFSLAVDPDGRVSPTPRGRAHLRTDAKGQVRVPRWIVENSDRKALRAARRGEWTVDPTVTELLIWREGYEPAWRDATDASDGRPVVLQPVDPVSLTFEGAETCTLTAYATRRPEEGRAVVFDLPIRDGVATVPCLPEQSVLELQCDGFTEWRDVRDQAVHVEAGRTVEVRLDERSDLASLESVWTVCGELSEGRTRRVDSRVRESGAPAVRSMQLSRVVGEACTVWARAGTVEGNLVEQRRVVWDGDVWTVDPTRSWPIPRDVDLSWIELRVQTREGEPIEGALVAPIHVGQGAFRTPGAFPGPVSWAATTSADGRARVPASEGVGIAVLAEGFGISMRQGVPEEVVLRPYPSGSIALEVTGLPPDVECDVRVEKTAQPFRGRVRSDADHALEMTAPLREGVAEFWAGPNGRRTLQCGLWSADIPYGTERIAYTGPAAPLR